MGVGFIVLFTFRLEIILFYTLRASGRGRAVGFYRDRGRWGWFGQVFTVLASDSFSLFRLNSFLYVSQIIYDVCFPNHI